MTKYLDLVQQAKSELRLSNRMLAELTGAALRTIERKGLGPEYAPALIKAIFPINRTLAGDLAMAAGTSLEALALVPRAPAPAPVKQTLTDAEATREVLFAFQDAM